MSPNKYVLADQKTMLQIHFFLTYQSSLISLSNCMKQRYILSLHKVLEINYLVL